MLNLNECQHLLQVAESKTKQRRRSVFAGVCPAPPPAVSAQVKWKKHNHYSCLPHHGSHVCSLTTQTHEAEGREMLLSLTSFASVCCCSLFFFFLSFFLSLHWPALAPAAPALPCRGFPDESRPPLAVFFPASDASESESESIWSRAKREAVVGTVIIADDAMAKRKTKLMAKRHKQQYS